ncbi:MAG TPA: hypothetical protein O0X39_03600 [Methanocorpusculum sp.]|nr:hypothetical protein [Methanocorpusculum sp.]
MKKALIVLGVLLVLLAAVAAAGCTSTDNGNAGQQGAAPSGGNGGASSGDTHSIAGSWICENTKARDTFQATEVVLNADGTGSVTYYKQIVNGPTTNVVKWYWDDKVERFHIESGAATTYLPTAYYDLSADGKTLTGSTATLTRA